MTVIVLILTGLIILPYFIRCEAKQPHLFSTICSWGESVCFPEEQL